MTSSDELNVLSLSVLLYRLMNPHTRFSLWCWYRLMIWKLKCFSSIFGYRLMGYIISSDAVSASGDCDVSSDTVLASDDHVSSDAAFCFV